MTKKQTNSEPRTWGVLDPTGLIVNVIVWDGVTEFGHDYELVEIGDQYAGIGFRWDGKKFIDERPPTPSPFDE